MEPTPVEEVRGRARPDGRRPPRAEPRRGASLQPERGRRSSRPSRASTPPGDARRPGRLRRRSRASREGGRRAVGIVVSRFNGEITAQAARGGARRARAAGVAARGVTVMPVPGAFELPLAAMALAKTRRYACIVALGCVIRGDTPHFDYVAGEAASAASSSPRSRPASRSPSACSRSRRPTRPTSGSRRAPRPSAPASRWRTCSRSSAQRRSAEPSNRLLLGCYHPPPCPRSAHSAARSRRSATTGATRWWRRKRRFNPNLQRVRVLAERRRQRAYVCTRCLKAGKVQKAHLAAAG